MMMNHQEIFIHQDQEEDSLILFFNQMKIKFIPSPIIMTNLKKNKLKIELYRKMNLSEDNYHI